MADAPEQPPAPTPTWVTAAGHPSERSNLGRSLPAGPQGAPSSAPQHSPHCRSLLPLGLVPPEPHTL